MFKQTNDEQRLYIYPPPIAADYDRIFQLSVAVHFYQCVTKEINY